MPSTGPLADLLFRIWYIVGNVRLNVDCRFMIMVYFFKIIGHGGKGSLLKIDCIG